MKPFKLTEYDLSVYDVQAVASLTFNEIDKCGVKFVESVIFSDLRMLAPVAANLVSDAINRNCC